MQNASAKWHWTIRLSHWATVVVLVPLFYTGFSAGSGHFTLPETHGNLGAALLVVLLMRLLSRAMAPRPAGYRSKASALTQAGLYVVLFGLIISGLTSVPTTAFLPRPTLFGGLFDIPSIDLVPPQLAHLVHRWLGYGLIFLVGLHVASAIWHRARDRTFLSRIV
jgi:cytochrome b561